MRQAPHMRSHLCSFITNQQTFQCVVCLRNLQIEQTVPLFDKCSKHASNFYCWDCLSAALFTNLEVALQDNASLSNLGSQKCLVDGCESDLPVWAVKSAVGEIA